MRARDVFVVQPTCAPTNENLMEMCILVDAIKRARARRHTAVMPEVVKFATLPASVASPGVSLISSRRIFAPTATPMAPAGRTNN